jgi:hypothetical protein
MKTRSVVRSMALALALHACSDRAQQAAGPAKAPAGDQARPKADAAPQAAAGTLVDWHELAPFIPDRVGEYEQREEIQGEAATIEEKPVARVVRKYEAGLKTLFVTITDVIAVDAMRAAFAMAPTLNVESAGGHQKGKRIGRYPAIVVWEANLHRSEVSTLVADRFIVKVDVRKASSDDEAEKLIVMLDIDRLNKLRPTTK